MMIYDNTVDQGKYHVTVSDQSEDGYRAVLRVHEGDTLIHEETVGVAYQALFGPDVADVAEWENTALDVIDHPEKRVVQ